MHKTRITVGILLVVLVASGVDLLSQAKPEEAVHWKGEISMIHRQAPPLKSFGFVGDVVGTYQLRVDWKESHRIEVKNEQGTLTGVLVILTDHDSQWSAEVSGIHQGPCSRWIYEGAGAGTETLEHGWIYFSLSDDDPILDVMPHGTYHINGLHSGLASGSVTYESGLCGGSAYSNTNERNLYGLMLLEIGRELWRPLPCTTPETCRSATFRASALPASAPWIPAEALKAKLERDFIPASVNGGGRIDPEPRVVTDNTMRGHYLANAIGTEATGFDTVELTWDLERVVATRVILDLAATEWLPDGSPSDEAAPLEITARIEGAQQATEGKFRFTLYEVTREPGYALNAGEKDDTSPDLEFEASQPGFTEPVPTDTSEAWEIETTELVNETTVIIRARDYGAWAKLRCEVNIDGAWHECRTERDEDYITIPHDTDGDRIADLWEDEYGVRDQDQTADLDSKPEDQNDNGDGISLYEEYRGFVDIDGKHQRLHPDIKTLFVRDQDNLVATSTFEVVSGLTVFFLGETGWTGPNDGYYPVDLEKRVVNFNTSGYGHEIDQHALHVLQDQLFGNNRFKESYRRLSGGDTPPETLLGQCAGSTSSQLSSPASCSKVLLFSDAMAGSVRRSLALANATRQTALSQEERDSALQQMRNTVTVHEMGHGINMQHHYPKADSGDVHCYMHYFKGSRALSGLQPWPSIFTTLPHCYSGTRNENATESCWGQIQVSSISSMQH